jgi:hypothetical protein
LLSTSYKTVSNILLSRLSPYIEELIGDHQCGFIVIDQLLIRFLHLSDTGGKKWEYDDTVHQLFIDFKKAYDSVTREGLYNILGKQGGTEIEWDTSASGLC